MKSIKIAGAALNQIPMDWDSNFNNIVETIREAQQKGIGLLCLPELCITGYGCEDQFLSQWLPREALNQLILLLPHTADIAVAIGLPVRFKGLLYNCSCLVRNKEILGFTAKQFLANDGVHYEPRWFTSWVPAKINKINFEGKFYDFGDIMYDIQGYKVAFEICEDAWREDLRPGWKHLEHNVDIILNPSASHFALGKSELRANLVSSSSKKFNCLYVYANLLGNESGRMIYDGEVLFGLHGKIILKNNKLLSFKSCEILAVDYKKGEDPIVEKPAATDPEILLQEFTQASSLALFDYLRKSKSRGFTLSLSGGADSSACAILVAHMIRKGVKELGISNFLKKINREDIPVKPGELAEVNAKIITNHLLTCVYQGTKNSSIKTFDSAKLLADAIGANFYNWTIDEEVNSYTTKVEAALQRKLDWERDDIALQNIQARARSPIIWMIANIQNSLLITTSNRSEGDVGYATMDGDTSGSIAPIAAIDKHFILHWLKWAESTLGYFGLQGVNNLTPSAELRPADKEQTDEKDLMPYHIIVEIERLAIRDRKSPVQVYEVLSELNLEPKKLLKAHIEKFFKLWARNQWKRERIAPSFHLDDFNIDPRTWCRFPILSGSFAKELQDLENTA